MLHMQTPDTAVVKQAEASIKAALKSPRCVCAMVALLTQSQHASVRQLSAVLLRLKVNKLWHRLDAGPSAP